MQRQLSNEQRCHPRPQPSCGRPHSAAWLLLSALCYSAYHIAYGMSTGEMLYLLGFGIVFGAMFRLAKNVLVLWPFYTPMGGFYTTFKDGLVLPFEATYGFVVVLTLMGVAIAAGSMMLRHKKALSFAQRRP